MGDLYESFLIEDLEGFINDLRKVDVITTDRTKYGIYNEFPAERHKAGRKIKQAFAKHVDRDFINSLYYGHTATVKGLLNLIKNPDSSAEISARFGTSLDDVVTPLYDNLTAIVKGHVTLAASSMDCVYSGPYQPETPEGWPTQRKCSGFSKYPGVGTERDFQSYVLGPDDLVDLRTARKATRIHDIRGGYKSLGNSEALLANWEILSVYFNVPKQSDSGYARYSYFSDKNDDYPDRVDGEFVTDADESMEVIYQCYLKRIPVYIKDFSKRQMVAVVDKLGNIDEEFLISLLYHVDEEKIPYEFMETWIKMSKLTDYKEQKAAIETKNESKEHDLYYEISEALLEVVEDLDEKKRKKKKKKKKKGGKKDACYHKVKSRYRVWPSAYASGALVKCRKVGAANWGNKSKKKNESIESDACLLQVIKEELQAVLQESKLRPKPERPEEPPESASDEEYEEWEKKAFEPYKADMKAWRKEQTVHAKAQEEAEKAKKAKEDAAYQKQRKAELDAQSRTYRNVNAAIRAAQDKDLDKLEAAFKTLGIKVDPRFINDQIEKIRKILNDPGYGSFDKATSYVKSLMANQTTSESLERIIKEELQAVLDEKKKKRKKRKKAGTESSKESSLRDWFGRKGAKGKKKGWVDCNAPDGKGGYKSCGRSSGEGRKKYPACRPTPGACKERGKGKSWGKKAAKKKK